MNNSKKKFPKKEIQGREKFKKYLIEDFGWKKDLVILYRFIEDGQEKEEEEIYPYEEIIKALNYLKQSDPLLFRVVNFKSVSHRSINDLALSLDRDSMTIKRQLDTGINILINYIEHTIRGDVLNPAGSIDILSN